MTEVKGKFITLAASLMSVYKDKLEQANKQLYQGIGKHWDELDPEGWYDVKYYKIIMKAYTEASPSKENALITLGKQIYPTIKKTVGFPSNLNSPIDYFEFENKSYQENLRGPDIKPRKIIKKNIGYVVIQTKMFEQDCKVLEGVYLGIMNMSGVMNGEVHQEKCLKKGDDFCEFHIKWRH